jgi:hypothetical protein
VATNRKNTTRSGIPVYKAEINGKTVWATVPENEAQDVLGDAVRDSLSPKAVAAIAAHLFAASTKDSGVNKEIRWFADRLLSLVGVDEYNRLMDEVGL